MASIIDVARALGLSVSALSLVYVAWRVAIPFPLWLTYLLLMILLIPVMHGIDMLVSGRLLSTVADLITGAGKQWGV